MTYSIYNDTLELYMICYLKYMMEKSDFFKSLIRSGNIHILSYKIMQFHLKGMILMYTINQPSHCP